VWRPWLAAAVPKGPSRNCAFARVVPPVPSGGMGNTQGSNSPQSFASEAPTSSELGDVKMISGHLLVLRKNALKWDAAYFVLTASTLFMYRELKAYEAGTTEMEIPLAGSVVHIEKGLFKPPLFADARERCIRLYAQGKMLHLSTDNVEGFAVWSDALRRSTQPDNRHRFESQHDLHLAYATSVKCSGSRGDSSALHTASARIDASVRRASACASEVASQVPLAPLRARSKLGGLREVRSDSSEAPATTRVSARSLDSISLPL